MFRAHGLIEGDLYIGALFSIHDQVNHIDYDNICCCFSHLYFCVIYIFVLFFIVFVMIVSGIIGIFLLVRL